MTACPARTGLLFAPLSARRPVALHSRGSLRSGQALIYRLATASITAASGRSSDGPRVQEKRHASTGNGSFPDTWSHASLPSRAATRPEVVGRNGVSAETARWGPPRRRFQLPSLPRLSAGIGDSRLAIRHRTLNRTTPSTAPPTGVWCYPRPAVSPHMFGGTVRCSRAPSRSPIGSHCSACSGPSAALELWAVRAARTWMVGIGKSDGTGECANASRTSNRPPR